jgi:hypothetical protein
MERLSQHQPESTPRPEAAAEREQTEAAPERHHERVDAGAERHRQEAQERQARQLAAEQQARSAKEASRGPETSSAAQSGVYHGTSKKVAYRRTMQAVRQKLPPLQRSFSRLIHSRAVESVSDAAARSVFRPMPLAAAGLAATLVTGAVYAVARSKGYEIAGGGWFLASFAGGYVLGLLIDFFRLVALRRR